MVSESLGPGNSTLTKVSFCVKKRGAIKAKFVNHYNLTNVYLLTVNSQAIGTPLLPNIRTNVDSSSSLVHGRKTLLQVLPAYSPSSKQAIQKIGVADAAGVHHDGRALTGVQ